MLSKKCYKAKIINCIPCQYLAFWVCKVLKVNKVFPLNSTAGSKPFAETFFSEKKQPESKLKDCPLWRNMKIIATLPYFLCKVLSVLFLVKFCPFWPLTCRSSPRNNFVVSIPSTIYPNFREFCHIIRILQRVLTCL